MPSPSSSRPRRLGATLLATALVVPALAVTGSAAVAAPSSGPTAVPSGAGAADLARFKLAAFPVSASGTVSVFVQTSGPGALQVDAAAKGGRVAVGRRASAQGLARASAVRATTSSVLSQLRAADGKARALYTSAYTVPGVAVVADAAAVRTLAARPDVVSITPLVAKTIPTPVATPRATPAGGVAVASPMNSVEDDYTRTREAWSTTKMTGKGIAIAVIDTGLDYTHADFGGPGTTDAYYAAGRNAAAPTPGSYDPTKYLGGYDFAGLTYNAGGGNAPYQPYPQPDANPIDGPGGGHGTHVAGTAAGFGENPDGTTFRGDPTTVTSSALSAMKIGPGSAPQAGIYSLKVFGDFGGSTNLTGEALDWVGQALTQGTKIDVVSMSLGTGYAAPDDPDNLKVDALAAQGVLPVIAAGNDGDLTDVVGSPGSSRQALTVAAADSGSATLDGIDVLAPSGLTGANPYLGQYSVSYPDAFTLSGPVAAPADPANLTGCQPFSASDAARLAGHVAWLAWDDADVACGSKTRFDNAHAAGAVAVLLTGTRDAFEAGIAGDTEIPGFELTASAVAALKPALDAGTLAVTLDSSRTQVATVVVPELRDTLASFSSRGQHGSYAGLVKPDVAAPGVNVVSARAGGADASVQMSGTSMATPHTAGIAALVRQAHPTWTAGDVKADIMNTATHDLTVPGSAGAQPYGVLRQGTGRVDALQAVTNQVLVADPAGQGLVTASYGVVEAGGSTTVLRRQVQLTNRGSSPRTYALAYQARTTVPGVTFALGRRSVTVPAGGTASVTLTMTVDPSALRRTLDPTMSPTTADGRARDYVTAASGVLTLTPTGSSSRPASSPVSPLRLAVFAAPEPTSDRHATLGAATATGQTLTLSGRTLDQGTGSTAYGSLVAPFVLGATSPVQAPSGPSTQTLSALDLRAVGASSTAPLLKHRSQGLLSFGTQTQGPLADPGTASYAAVLVDVNRDGRPDFEVAPRKYPGSDLTVAVTFDLALGTAVDVQPFDSVPAGADGNLFDSSVSVLSVSLAALGYTDRTTATTLSYRAVTMSPYGTQPGVDGSGLGQVDATPDATFDVFAPPAWFAQGSGKVVAPGAAVLDDTAASLTAFRPTTGTAAVPLLVLHLQNAPGSQAERVTLPARR